MHNNLKNLPSLWCLSLLALAISGCTVAISRTPRPASGVVTSVAVPDRDHQQSAQWTPAPAPALVPTSSPDPGQVRVVLHPAVTLVLPTPAPTNVPPAVSPPERIVIPAIDRAGLTGTAAGMDGGGHR